MNTNKILVGGIAGGVALFFLGWLVYGMLLMDYMMTNMNQCAMKPMQDMVWWAMILSNLVWGITYAIIFSWSGINTFTKGLTSGLIIGLGISLSMDLSYYSMSSMFNGMAPMLVDVIAAAVMSGIGGGVTAWVMGMGKKEGA